MVMYKIEVPTDEVSLKCYQLAMIMKLELKLVSFLEFNSENGSIKLGIADNIFLPNCLTYMIQNKGKGLSAVLETQFTNDLSPNQLKVKRQIEDQFTLLGIRKDFHG